jgi:hypothetical protein
MEPNLDPAEVSGAALRSAQAISSSAIEALRLALRTRASAGNAFAHAPVRTAVRLVCAEARLQHYTPERLLVDLKDALRATPEVQRVPRGPERDDLVARVVTLCIDEFFVGTAPAVVRHSSD